MTDDVLAPIKADLAVTSGQISSQVRALVLGILAFTWLFLSGAKDIPAPMVAALPKTQLIAIAMLAIIALTADLLQYFCGFVYMRSVLDTAEAANAAPRIDENAVLYKARLFWFWAKQLTAFVAVIWLLVLLSRAVIA